MSKISIGISISVVTIVFLYSLNTISAKNDCTGVRVYECESTLSTQTEDPELAIDRAMQTYLKKGYSKDWINQRLKTIEVRKELTDEWQERGVEEGLEFAILTDEITKAWSGKSIKQYKSFKGLKKQNLRDNMTNLELILNMLAEATTTETEETTDAGSEMLVVRSKIKTVVEDVNIAKDFYEALNQKVKNLIKNAEERCKANDRKTLRPCDL